MAFSPQHVGLYFTSEHVQAARKDRDQKPLDAAWAMLRERQQRGAQEAQWCAYRYLFDDDTQAGGEAVRCLLKCVATDFGQETTYLQAIDEMLALAQAFEMLRSLVSFEISQQARFLDLFSQRLDYLNGLDYARSSVETVWQAHLNLVAGIALEREPLFERGVEVYRRIIREDIHPQGYIAGLVEARDGGGLLRQLLVTRALVLMAEAAEHAGVSLWDYNHRQVSVMTAFTYTLYYYFFPDKWRWDDHVTNEPYRDYAGFFEIVNRRAYPKDLKPLLDDLRPIYDPPGGGLTTLTHGVVRRRGLFG